METTDFSTYSALLKAKQDAHRAKKSELKDRALRIAEMYLKEGKSLAQNGKVFGISRARVHQILLTYIPKAK
jgi:DNA-directed RNA polymerase specialized sigma subunit